MFTEFKGMHSPDTDLKSFYPEDPENFSIFIQVFFGPKGEDGMESFNFTVCTQKWLKEHFDNEFVILRDILLVPEYNFQKIEDQFKKLASSITGKDWREIGTKLSRYGEWEFEDYQPNTES